MKVIKFYYGKKKLDLKLSDDWDTTVLLPKSQNKIENPVPAIRESINHPVGSPRLKEIISNKGEINEVCIVVSDATRPVPSHIMLEALVSELQILNVSYDKILVLIATGLHRISTKDDLERILGPNLRDTLRVIDHQASKEEDLVYVGRLKDDDPIYLNKHFVNADIKILTGYVEPHFFAGFSGGRKSVVPGIAGEKTIQKNHTAKIIASPFARFGIYKKNPIHRQSTEISRLVGVDFIVNVCINENHEIVKVISGDLEEAHELLVNYQLQHVFSEISDPYDIVVCGNGGFPLDLNLYQAVKSMAIGEIAVKEGGTIISVNELSEGIGIGQNNFRSLIFSGTSPKKLYKHILNNGLTVPDQWEIQVLCRILMKAEIFVVSSLKEKDLGKIGLKYAKTVEDAIKKALKKHGSNAKILLLPHGPQVLPLIKA